MAWEDCAGEEGVIWGFSDDVYQVQVLVEKGEWRLLVERLKDPGLARGKMCNFP